MKHASTSNSRRSAHADDHIVHALLTNNDAREAHVEDIQVVRAEWHTHADAHQTREQLITEAAYHRAEARGFVPGHALEDWLAAEAEVDARRAGEGRAY